MYESYPTGPAGQQLPEPGQRPPVPQSVQIAVRLMYAGAVVSAISFILGLVTLGSLKHTIQTQHPDYSASKVNSLVDTSIGLVVVVGIIGIGLWIWMARANLAGKNWARITGTVFFGIDTLTILGLFSGTRSAISVVFAIVTWLIGLGAVIMLWRRESSAYFRPPVYQ
jgi:hypothetical protein